MSNGDDSMRLLVQYTHPEYSESMKYVDDNIIDEIQGKLVEVEVNPDDDDYDLKFGEFINRMENKDTVAEHLKHTN